MSFNQGAPGVSQIINASNVFVYGNTSTGNALSVQQLGAGNVFVTSNASGTVGLFVNARSNVGIGTTNPLDTFQVTNSAGLYTNTENTGGNQLSLRNSGANGTTLYMGADNTNNIGYLQAVGSSAIKPLVLQGRGGNVGVGTTSPQGGLDVYATTGSQWVTRIVNVKNDGGSSNTCFIHSDQPAIGTTNYTGSVLDVTSYPNDAATNLGYIARFGTSAADGTSMDPKVVILAGNSKRGYVGIGTTNPTNLISLYATGTAFQASSGGLIFQRSDAATSWTISGPDTGNTLRIVNAGGTGVQLVNTTTAWAAGSDSRLKNIIEPISNAISKVNQLATVIYSWNTDDTNTPHPGLIAQDVVKVQPEAVSEDTNGMLSVRYTELIPLAFAAIKELSAENTALKARLDSLEQRLAALEAK